MSAKTFGKNPVNKRGGHNRKSSSVLKAEGGYRADRHSERIDAQIEPKGKPRKPRGLENYQKKLWDDIVSTFPVAALGDIDTTMLTELLAWYGRYKNADELQDQCKAWDRFAKLATEYGLTPSSRAALKFHDKTPEEDHFENLLDRFKGVA